MSSSIARVRQILAMAAAVAAIMATPAAAHERSCAWALQVSGDQLNAFYPDEAANYWVAIVPIPPGGHLELDGRYPHARYMSFHTYTPLTQAIDALADAEIAPDAGSSNPFVAGADRTGEPRDYTVTVTNERVPAGGRAPNTLYTENADGSKSSRATQLAGIEFRVYQPDIGLDITGGAGLPDITLVAADGDRQVISRCPGAGLPDPGYTPALAQASVPAPLPEAGLLGHAQPRWRKYTNIVTMQASLGAGGQAAAGPAGDPLAAETDARLPSGGSGENTHNKYIYATFSREFGEVLVLRGKLPTTPRTRDGQPTMEAAQLRYWSLCTNAQETSAYACVTDDQVAVDERGEYAIAVSAGNARPRNATEACGVTWMPAGPVPQSVLLMRNMLPAPDFEQAIQRVTPGQERSQMGAYYPLGTYYPSSAAAEAALGCAR